MKRICLSLLLLCSLFASSVLAQDAATEERLNKIAGQLEDLMQAQRDLQKQIQALSKEIESVREHANKPTATYATPDDLKKLADAIREVDRKRMEDAEKIAAQVTKLGTKMASTASNPPKREKPSTSGTSESANNDKPQKDEKVFPYTIQQGDTLSVIVQAYREKNIKITSDQILKANPGLKADKLRVGQKIWIPAPQA